MLKRAGRETFVSGKTSSDRGTFLLQRTTVGWWRDILVYAREGHYWRTERHYCWRGPLLASEETFILERVTFDR
jgi:hypothetical protein